MGYDCHFQLIDAAATARMLEALVAGSPPPPSAFDALPEAASLWTRAREWVLGPDRVAAARAAGELVAHWNAASFAFVWTRNLGATYHPIRMEDALKGFASGYFMSPTYTLFGALPADLAWSGRLEGSSQIGGYVVEVDEAAADIRALYDDLHEPMQRRLRPILALFRAAQRHGLTVLESTDLLSVTSAHAAMLHWPGLARFGLDGDALSAEEWSAFARARPPATDLHDALDRIVACDPRDADARRAVLSLLTEHASVEWSSAERARIASWITQCIATEDLALASRAMAAYGAGGAASSSAPDESALVALLASTDDPAIAAHWIERYSPPPGWGPARETMTPSAPIAAALLEALCRLAPRFGGVAPGYFARHLLDHGASTRAFALLLDGDARVQYLHEIAMDLRVSTMAETPDALLRSADAAIARGAVSAGPARWYGEELARIMERPVESAPGGALRERAAELWCALYEREPSIGPTYAEDYVDDVVFVQRVAERLLRGPRSTEQLRAVAATLRLAAGWEDDDGDWIAPFCERNRGALRALIELGLASDDRGSQRAASSLLAPAAMDDGSAERALRDAVERGELARIEELAPRVRRTRENAPLFAKIELAAFVEAPNPSMSGIVRLLEHGLDVCAEAMRGAIAAQRESATSARSIAGIGVRLSSELINAGWPRQAIAVVDAALEAVAREQSATLLYNQSCAWAKLGDASHAARALSAAAAIDASQLADARTDADFEAIRSDPAFAALFVR